MVELDACAGRGDVGGKAETLARMRAAGVAAANGVVVLPDERVDAAELRAALERLTSAAVAGGGRFAVRSSSSLEDAAGGSAAGVFESILGVEADDVERAIEEVRASARGPAVTAYLRARGAAAAAVRMAVLVQPVVAGEVYGVAHSGAAAFAVEERAPGEPEWGDVRARRVSRDGGAGGAGGARGEAEGAAAIAAGMRVLEGIVGGPVDAEFARTGDAVTWLQARPLVAPPAPAAASAVAIGEPGRWRRDGEHNPDPLSAAQASLVAFADGLGVGARLRVVDGYLYVEADGPARGAQPRIPLAELRRRFDDEIAPDLARALDDADADGSLDAALAAYAHVYRRYYGEVSPSVGVARKAFRRYGALQDALLAGAGGATLERDQLLWELGRGTAMLADYNVRFGDHAPSWDVATPTDRERPDRVRALAAELAAQPTSPRARHDAAVARADAAAATVGLDDDARAAREALPIAEDDDLLFLRAQATVRRALIALGAGDDAFDVTLDEARAGDFSRAAEGRRARQNAAGRVPPARARRRRARAGRRRSRATSSAAPPPPVTRAAAPSSFARSPTRPRRCRPTPCSWPPRSCRR